jgi:hypothetical protein
MFASGQRERPATPRQSLPKRIFQRSSDNYISGWTRESATPASDDVSTSGMRRTIEADHQKWGQLIQATGLKAE